MAHQPRPHCPNCGAQVFASDEFCMECGFNLRLGVRMEEAPEERRRDFHRWAAQRALERRQYRTGEKHLITLWQLLPEDWETGRLLASTQEAQWAFERALATWQRLIAVHQSAEARTGYVECALRIAEMQQSRHAYDQAIETCRRAINVVGEVDRLQQQIYQIRDAEVDYHREETGFAEGRRARAQTATVAGGFGAVTGALTMVAGVLLIMLGLAMVPCCIGIFILPVAFSVFAAGVAMLAGAPAGGAAVYTIGELPRAMKRFGEYWHGLSPEARHKAVVGIVIAIGIFLALGILGAVLGTIPAGTGY